MVRDFWSDLKLALMLMVFVYVVQWMTGITGSKKVGIVIAAVVAYLTIFSHFEILLFVILFFFAYPFWDRMVEGFAGEPRGEPT